MKSRDHKSPASGDERRADNTVDPARLLEDAGKRSLWVSPPEAETSAAASLPGTGAASMAPRPGSATHGLDWPAPDVRGAGAGAVAGQPRTATHAFEAGEVTMIMTPPRGDACWKIQGIVWLREPADAPLRVFWVHGEHVVHELEAEEGELFEMEEFVGSGWQVEIHLPDETVLRIVEPGS